MEKLIFYNNTRCHAKVVDGVPDGYRYVGTWEFECDYEIWQKKTPLFDQFGFIALRK